MGMKKFIKKIFALPGPKDLGMSNDNHSMIWKSNPNATGHSWDDYYAVIKKDYPIRFFFQETLVNYFNRNIKNPIERGYWFILNTFHPKHRHHILDLREPKNLTDGYRRGWIDSDTKLALAMFKIVVDFVEKEMPGSHVEYSLEAALLDDAGDQDSFGCRRQYDFAQEIKASYNYWTVERHELQKQSDLLLSMWHSAHRAGRKCDDLFNASNIQEEYNANKLKEMMHRIIEIKDGMWT